MSTFDYRVCVDTYFTYILPTEEGITHAPAEKQKQVHLSIASFLEITRGK